jgi:hypothetical protein
VPLLQRFLLFFIFLIGCHPREGGDPIPIQM